MAVCWDDTMVITLRAIIDDLGEDPEYSEEKLKQLIVASAKIVSAGFDFSADYVIDVANVTISPDPSNDDAFVSLVVLKAACFLAMAEQKRKAGRGVSIKDGPSNIDGRGAADATAKWSDKVCKDYTTAELAARVGNMIVGQAIVSPYRFDGSPNQDGPGGCGTCRPGRDGTGEYFS